MDTKKFKKQSGFNNDRDSYVTDEGDIVYTEWVKIGGQWKRRELVRVKYADLEASGQTEIVFAIDESHRDIDLQKDHDERNADKVIARQQAGESGGDDTDFTEDPLEQIADPHGDVFDQLFPEDEEPENPQIEIVRRVIESLPEKEQDMFWARYGELQFLEDIRRADLERDASATTQQAYSKRHAKIVGKVCDALGTEKPRKRTK